MSSKMREALNDAWLAGHGRKAEGASFDAREFDIDEIAQHYGPMFTREEVRGIARDFLCKVRGYWGDLADDQTEILSRHTEAEDTGEGCAVAEEEAVKRYGPDWKHNDTPAPNASEIEAACGDCGRELEEVRPGKHQCTYCEIVRAAARDLEDRLTKRVAAIENRVLADGHSRKCEYAVYIGGECTCSHDEIQERSK